MRTPVLLALTTTVALSTALAGPEPGPAREDPAAQAALQSYLDTAPNSREWLRDVSMEMNIEASLPRLKKTGTLRALRYISNIGKITYRAVTFQGDNTVKKDVIGKYLEAESKAGGSESMGITPQNYKFKYYGLHGEGDWQLYLFELTPRAKRMGLFKGWLWIHAATGLPVREQGELVKNPSIFLKKVTFVRDYELRDGVAIPVRMESSIDTRIVGRAELSILFSNVSKQVQPAVANGSARRVAARSTGDPQAH